MPSPFVIYRQTQPVLDISPRQNSEPARLNVSKRSSATASASTSRKFLGVRSVSVESASTRWPKTQWAPLMQECLLWQLCYGVDCDLPFACGVSLAVAICLSEWEHCNLLAVFASAEAEANTKICVPFCVPNLQWIFEVRIY